MRESGLMRMENPKRDYENLINRLWDQYVEECRGNGNYGTLESISWFLSKSLDKENKEQMNLMAEEFKKRVDRSVDEIIQGRP